MESIEKDHKEYAGKGLAGTALGFGIGGVALSLLNNKNLFGLGSNNNSCNGPTSYQVESKECEDVLALTNTIWGLKVDGMNARFNDRQTVNQEMFGIYKSQIDADFGLYKNSRDQFDVLANRIGYLENQVAVNTAIRPYQDKLIQCEIDRVCSNSINYTDRKTCKALYGVVGLPSTPTVSILEGANANCVNPYPFCNHNS